MWCLCLCVCVCVGGGGVTSHTGFCSLWMHYILDRVVGWGEGGGSKCLLATFSLSNNGGFVQEKKILVNISYVLHSQN